MLRAERLLVYGQRAFEKRARPCKVALVPKQCGEVVEGRRRIGMLRAKRLFSYRQCALKEGPRCCKIALALEAGERGC